MRKILFDAEIKNNRIRLIDNEKGLIGEFDKAIALQKARDLNMNLIQISSIIGDSGPISVCVIQDYNKYVYNQNRSNKKQKISNKEITIGSNIDMKDMIRKLDYICDITTKDNIPVILVITRRRRVDYESIEQFIKSYFVSKDTHNIKAVKQTNKAIRFYITKKKK